MTVLVPHHDELGAGLTVEPLTHCDAGGAVYERTDVVERQIREALALPQDRLAARAAVRDEQSPDFLKEECLVYLVRHYHRAGQRQLVNQLAEALLRRSARLIHSHLHSLDTEASRNGYDSTVAALFGQILDLDSDRGDFLQVRFWLALKRLAIRAFNQQLAQRENAKRTVSISSIAGHDHDDTDEGEHFVRASADQALTSPPPEDVVVEDDLIRDALQCIDEPYRSAFLLRHYLNWPIEDQDLNVQTISRHFGKDPRTIRNWLKEASEALEAWRRERA